MSSAGSQGADEDADVTAMGAASRGTGGVGGTRVGVTDEDAVHAMEEAVQRQRRAQVKRAWKRRGRPVSAKRRDRMKG